ncbi:MAG TPA: sugar ABC transporter permease [Virgibacillus sp.]|nr:sugar ABC transporter permease [Virgibacillus sp.]HLR69358.1 sugar ABC transporter permease [Virgibacillus sp.]
MAKRTIQIQAETRRGLAFVAPGLLVTALIILYPIIYIFYLSMTSSESGVNEFVGLSNFADVIQGNHFIQIIKNTIIWTFGTVSIAFILGMILSLLLNQKFIKFKGFWTTVLLLSWITPGVVKAIVWKWLYSYDFGMLNHMLLSVGVINEPVSWLMNSNIALGSVMLVQIWETFPFAMLMIYAGLQAIPNDLFEVADLEGANKIQKFIYVILPSLKDVTFISLLILIIWSLNGFVLIWLLTEGGPAGSTQILALSIYDDFRSFNITAASATAILQLGVSLIFATWYIKKLNK